MEATTSTDERALIDRLLEGDEAAFSSLVERYHAQMVRVARAYCGSSAVDEVVQDTWMAVLKGLPKFQARSSLKTWIFRILVNRARTTGVKEKRSTPLSGLVEDNEPMPDPATFTTEGHWSAPPAAWSSTPEKLAEDAQTARLAMEAIAGLPERQRLAITLRDVQGLTSAEVCNVMEISDTNQRVLLHRARTKVRKALADHLAGKT